MESSPIPSYTAQNSKKRVFSGSSNEPDAVMIGPLSADQISESKAKGKQEEEVPVESGYSSKGFSSGSNNFVNLDEYDAYSSLQSHFDNLDIPTEIEYHIPWLQDLLEMNEKTPAIPSVTSYAQLASSQSQPNGVDPSSTSTSLPLSKLSPASQRRPTYYVMPQSNTKYVSAQSMPYNQSQNMPYTEFGSGYNFSHMPYSYTGFGNGTSSFSTVDTPYSGWDKPVLKNNSELNDVYSSFMSPANEGIYSMKDTLVGQDTGSVISPNSRNSSLVGSSSSLESLDSDEVLKRYESFKNFDTVVDFSDHLYANQNSAMTQPPKNWAKRILEEWRILEKDLPDTIFVRVYESRMDILRAAIIGAEGTPYHDGLFFFDVCFPSSYPNSPPLVLYHSGGLHINPNLYNCGKVCLSLLNTWIGSQQENWIPGTSTMLQVLVSIQGLILNTKPYFNEPGLARSSGTVTGEQQSLLYNENILILSLKTMVYTMNKPPKNFEDLVVGHFRNRVRDILMACKAYTEGVQVGCFVRGGVQDVDEGNNSCSHNLKINVTSYLKTLIDAFKKIGAKEAEEFLPLTEKVISPLLTFAPMPLHFHGPSPFGFNPPISGYNHYW